jgi:hypothetical protein
MIVRSHTIRLSDPSHTSAVVRRNIVGALPTD